MIGRFHTVQFICAIAILILPFHTTAQGGKQSKSKAEEVHSNENPQVPANNHLERSEKTIAEPSRTALSGSYYRAQTTSLRETVMAAPYVANGWLNYYKAERFASFSSTSNDIQPGRQSELDEIVTEMKKYVPESYEFHYVTYLNGNNNVDLFPHLVKAYELNPQSTELLDDFIAYYELTGNASKKKEFCQKLSDSREISPGVMEYNYNVLASVEPNSILITHGEMDTYPVWILQLIKSTRTDVTILYADLLEKDEYRSKKIKELGITVNASFSNRSAFFDELASRIKRPVYFASTVSPSLLQPLSSRLFVTGLTFRYSLNEISNVEIVKNNWENKFQKEKLLKNSIPGTLDAKMNMNYLPAMILLIEHYRAGGEHKKAKETEDLAIRIASAAGKEQQVRQLLKK